MSAQGTDVNKRLGSRLWKLIFRWEARRATWVHAVSDDLADKLRDIFHVDPAKLLVSAIGISTESLPYVEPTLRPSRRGVVCPHHAHDPVYDQATLVRAVKRLRRTAGSCARWSSRVDAELPRPNDSWRNSESRIPSSSWTDFTTMKLPSILAAADVYVSCSHSDGTSQSLLEALATGTFPS